MQEATINPTTLNGRAIWLARAAWMALFLLILGMLVANVPYLASDTRQEWLVGEALPAALVLFPSTTAFVDYVVILKMVAALAFGGTALFLIWRKSDDWMVLFTSAALLLMVYLFGFGLNVDTIRYPRLLEQIFPAVRIVAPTLMIVALIGLFFLFPDGRFYPRWNLAVASVTIGLSTLFFYKTFDPAFEFLDDQLAFLPEDWAWNFFVYSLLAAIIMGLVSRLVYYRRVADISQRQQIKLVLFGLGFLVTIPFLQPLLLDVLNVFPSSWRYFILLHGETILPMALPLTIGMSVLRYRLWQVDLLINRTLMYGLLTALIVALYGLSVGIGGILLPAESEWYVPLMALGVVIFAVAPLRNRLQQLADRRLPVYQVAAPDSHKPEKVESSPIMLMMQGVWLLLLILLMWQTIVQLSDFDRLVRVMQTEWIVQESLPAISFLPAADFARLLVTSNIWTIAVSWLTAGIVFWRKRHHGIALYAAFLMLISPFSFGPGVRIAPVAELLPFLGIGLGILFLFIFPDGRLVPRSWRWRGALIAIIILTPSLSYALIRVLLPEYSPDEHGYASFIITIAAIMVAGITSQIYRYRRLSDVVQRRQTRWVLLGLGSTVAWFLWATFWITSLAARLPFPGSTLALITLLFTVIASAGLPLSIAVAIMYDRLWQVDVILNRTLVYGALTGLVIILYVLVVGLLGAVFQSGDNLLVSVVATGLIAILFNPLRQRLQLSVNRFMYGRRDNPMTVLAELGKKLENAAVPGETLPALVDTISQTLKLPYVAIEMGAAGDGHPATVSNGQLPAGDKQLVRFPLVYHNETLGNLIVGRRAEGEHFTTDEEQLLGNVARQAGAAVHTEQLMGQLQRSRQHLVATREEERRRLRRDLHDGLGPQLATLNVKVSAAQNLLGSDPGAAERLLAEIKAESQSAIKEIRRVVDGLRPSALDQLGLVSALREFVNQNGNDRTRITFHTPELLPPLPAAVEVAAYRIVTEALTNVSRHADAQTCTVHITVNGDLCLVIADDGNGLPAGYQPGVGLSSMRERAFELGGRFELASEPAKGTRLIICLPFREQG